VDEPAREKHRPIEARDAWFSLVRRAGKPALEVPVEPGFNHGLPARYGQMRSSAAEREHVIDILKTGFAEGRLTKDEYEDRVGLALGPLTYAELATLTSDLPAALPGSFRRSPSDRPRPAPPPVNKMAIASLVTAVLPAVPLLPVLLGLIAHGQIQERGERGARIATAGMLIGGLFGLMFIILVLHG
jgi:uncharacterized membrane protein